MIFLDEIDSVLSARSSNEHEARCGDPRAAAMLAAAGTGEVTRSSFALCMTLRALTPPAAAGSRRNFSSRWTGWAQGRNRW